MYVCIYIYICIDDDNTDIDTDYDNNNNIDKYIHISPGELVEQTPLPGTGATEGGLDAINKYTNTTNTQI